MKKYIWTIIQNIIAIIVVAVMYGALSYSDDSIIILASLVLFVFVSVKGLEIQVSKANAAMVLYMEECFSRITPRDEDDTDDIESVKKDIKTNDTKMVINALGLTIVFIIALVNLIGAI